MGRELWGLGHLDKTPKRRFCKDAENLPEGEEGGRHPEAGLGVSPLYLLVWSQYPEGY